MPSNQEVRLEQRLLLHRWVNSLLGYDKTEDLLRDFRDVDEGFDAQGRSGVYRLLQSRTYKLDDDLLANLPRYDENIREHLASINRLREEPVTLRYFQHLALLYTEILLDRRRRSPAAVVRDLNGYAQNMEGGPSGFSREDLDKLAFWMATGSGKTLLMHINYYQFLHHNDEPLDNILLITPNEGLTGQHLDEMRLSGIPCERFTPGESGLNLADRDTVRATEITKIREVKGGKGESVDVESFEGRNLIFVDEGHKGSSAGLKPGEEGAWMSVRRRLAENGFTFEYSATFGQAVAKSTSNESRNLVEEYGRAILFDYSYRHFHGDGFGKDFEVLNLKNQTEEHTDLLLLGNLLSFYEQRRFFYENPEDAASYNLKSPLWIFVGSKVNAVYQQNRQTRSDVLTVLRFVNRFLRNDSGWSVENIEKLLRGNSGLLDSSDTDVFENGFEYVGSEDDPRSIFEDVMDKVFHVKTGGSLHVADIQGAEGELGLKVAGSERYFGLVYIGDTKPFKDLLAQEPEMAVEEEVIQSGSLFAEIEDDKSPINLLVGAKKFTEGWSSWRVSAMGLLNVGKSEGPQIIQLFGRGVRLLGREHSMKRSEVLDGPHPPHIDLLETLNVFGIEAGYMAQFKEYLEREGVDTEGYDEIDLPIRENEEFLNRGLLVPKVPEGHQFHENERVLLELEEGLKVSLDLSTRAELLRGMAGDRANTGTAASGEKLDISPAYLSMLDWDAIYMDLLDHKESKSFSNLIIPPDAPYEIMEKSASYELVAEPSFVAPQSFQDLQRLQEAVQSILRKYLESFYKTRQQRWDTEHMDVETLDTSHDNFTDYRVKVKRSRKDLLADVEELVASGDRLYEEELDIPPTVHFDRHLFQPLLVKCGEDIKSTPPALEPSEKDFVESLRDYLAEVETVPNGREIFLLRNLSRGKGIGFFNTVGFYPDFILWVKEEQRQRVVFVEPHGMRNDAAPRYNDKIQLHRELKTLSQALAEKRGIENVVLDSYIISGTPREVLKVQWNDEWKPEHFTQEHILFWDELQEKMNLVVEGP